MLLVSSLFPKSYFLGIKFLTLFLFIAPTLVVFLGCQITPQLSKTPDFNEESGRLFIHRLSAEATGQPRVLIDGHEVSDLNLLDQFGIVQNEGEHELELFDLPVDSGISEIDYRIKRDRDLHLYYCKEDGSFHWYMNRKGESIGNKVDFCRKASAARPQ